MSLAAFIGVALEKFGTTVQQFKEDYFRNAYRYYYSIKGSKELGPQSIFRYDKDGKEKNIAISALSKTGTIISIPHL